MTEGSTRKVKRPAIEREKTYVILISDEGLILTICKELLKSTTKMEKGQKEQN
jgi:hypothetical protein